MQHTELTKSFVSVIENVDLAQPTSSDLNDIKKLLYERKVLVFKRQTIDRHAYLNFARQFGALQQFRLKNYHDPEFPEILVINNLNRGDTIGARKIGNIWHNDSSYLPAPLPLTFLHAQRVPDGVGDTLFVDMAAALEELPKELLERTIDRQVEHDVRMTYKVQSSDVGDSISEILARVSSSWPASVHPAIISHPATGKKALYISPGYSVRIRGYSEEDSRALLESLFEHVFRPDRIFAHRWEKDDLVIWDNRTVVHSATAVPDDADRLMYRIGVTDGEFFGAEPEHA